jgi:hypothetical protein
MGIKRRNPQDAFPPCLHHSAPGGPLDGVTLPSSASTGTHLKKFVERFSRKNKKVRYLQAKRK